MFIEIEIRGRKTLLNINNISRVMPKTDHSCEINYFAYYIDFEHTAPFEIEKVIIQKSYDEFKQYIADNFNVSVRQL